MFGFSLLKLLFTVAVVVIVWQGYKWFDRLQNQRAQADRLRSGQGSEDMVKCGVCESFVAAAGATACERGDCPYSG